MKGMMAFLAAVAFAVATVPWSIAMMAAGQAVSPTPDPRIGTWILNLAKSTYPPGLAPQSQTLKWEAAPDGGFKLTTDGVDAQGQASHTETTAKVDGKDYPIQGGPSSAPARTRSTRRLNDYTFESLDTIKGVNVEVSVVRLETFSADGRTMTNSSTRTGPQGGVVRIVAVYDRQ